MFSTLVVAAPAAADEAIVIVDDRPADPARDRDRALGDAPFVTVVHPDDHPAAASVADAIATAAGTHVRSLGGLGSFQSVSIRGASPGHTTVALDGVPLARLASVTVDLGRFALDSFGRVDVYRGTVPLALGGAGVGGAVDLVTHLGRDAAGHALRISAGGGSFGARHLRARYGDTYRDRIATSITAGYIGATGDYAYFDNAGTPLNLRDDAAKPRTNNGFDQLDLAARAGTATTAGGLRLAYKQQGLPGATTNPTMGSRLTTLTAIADARTSYGTAYALAERQRLDDPDNEIGLGAHQRGYLTLAAGTTFAHAFDLAPHARAHTGGELRAERFSDEDLAAGATTSIDGHRLGGAALASLDLALAPELVITPALRLDVVRTAPAETIVGPDANMPLPERDDVVPSPRLGILAALSPDLALKSSAGYYVRLPTLVELFGNRGFVLGTPTLAAERGPSADVGLVYAPRGTRMIDRILVEAAAFGSRPKDTIAFVTYAGAVTRAQNIGRTQSYGAELVAGCRVARTIALTANYTRLVTEQLSVEPAFDGRAIPRQPGHTFRARAELAGALVRHAASVYTSAEYQAESFLDPANLGRVPGRTLVGAGASLAITRALTMTATVENLANTRIVNLPLDPPPGPTFTSTPVALTDVAGFPLPGRSFYLALQWTH